MTLLDAAPAAPATADDDDLTYRQATSRPPVPPLPRGLRLHTNDAGSRMGWTVACALLVTLGVQTWGASYLFTFAAFAGVLMIPVALWGMVGCWTRGDGPAAWLQGLVMTGTVVYVGVETARRIVHDPAYGTDAVAFGQYAAELAVAGKNPYTHSMLPSLEQYHVPFIYNTHHLDGAAMEQMSYPAFNFVAYMPFAAFGWTTQMAVVVNVAFWIVSGVILWLLLPKNTRFAAPLIIGSPMFVSFAIGGINDTLYLPFLLLAVWRWDRFADPAERSLARWIGPLAIGLAMATKQTPWFVFPFLLIGITLETRRTGAIRWIVPVRYAATAGAAFFAVNIPWILADPIAWWGGAVAPLTASFIPQGQGLINLTLAAGLGGGNLSFFTLAGAVWVLACLVAMVVRYGNMKRLFLILVIASFFFTPRSFGSYLMMMLPAALLAAVSVAPAPPETQVATGKLRRPALIAVGAVFAGSLAATIAAITAPSPLEMAVQDIKTNGQKMSILDVTVEITNRTDETLNPHFTVNSNGYPTNFWYPQGSTTGDTSITLAPRETQTVVLHAPDTASMPGVDSPFQVFAYTTEPKAISGTDSYVSSSTSVRLTPMGFPKPQKVGEPVEITAQLTDRLGRPVRESGVNVSLGQVVYAEAGLLGGGASINGMLQGASPGTASTDENGQVTFTVVGEQSRSDPTYFQAWMTGSKGEAPSGYSSIITIQFYGE